jgi:short-subunit dehydrogenase
MPPKGELMHSLTDRMVLITGAASGIGRELSHRLASEGARIGALDVQAEGLDTLAADLKGRTIACAVADVTDLAATRAAVELLEAHLGPTDLLIACAGIGWPTPARDFHAEDCTAMIRVNLIGVVNTVGAVLPGMRERGRGHLAALSSLASYRGMPSMCGYSASKAGLNAFLDALRVELRPLGISVTIVCPGMVRTPMTANLRFLQSYMMEVGDAGQRIVAALRARKAFVAFPVTLVWVVRLLRYLPRFFSDWIVYCVLMPRGK